MGWTEYTGQNMSPAEALEELRRLNTWSTSDGARFTVKADGITGTGDDRGYYAAIQIEKPGQPISTFCAVWLISLKPFGYKDMTEDMGPRIANPPRKVLEALLPLPDAPIVTEWKACSQCDGAGHYPPPNDRCSCSFCEGKGQVPAKDEERDRHRYAREWRREAWAKHKAPAAPCLIASSARPNISADRNAQLLALRLASPKRSAAPQHDVDGLALFDAARQPSLF